jgi:hypothetical protein
MQKPDDGMMLVHDHLVDVYMDLVEVEDADRQEIRQDFVEMVDIILDSLQLKLSSRANNETTIDFNCYISIPK